MKEKYSHSRNLVRILAMWVLLLVAMAVFSMLTGCTALKKNVRTAESSDTSATERKEKSTTSGNYFDRSKIDREDWELTYTPFDPTKEMNVRENADGSKTYNNAIPTYKKRSTKTNVDTGSTVEQENETNENSQIEKTEKLKWYEKSKFGVNVLALAFVAFFAMIFLMFVFVIWYFGRKINNQLKLLHNANPKM